MKYLLGIVLAASALPQTYEVGADIGYGIYQNGTIFAAAGSVEAGIRNRFAAGVDLGYEFSHYVSGQFCYLYHDGHPFLQAPSVKSDIQGQSHAITVELLFHFQARDRRFRPFVAGGVGGKDYVVAGPEPFPQPIPQIATLTTNDVWKLVLHAGGGIQYLLRPHVLLRGEFRDYITTFPRQQIVPAPHNTARGVFQQFTPLFGASYTF
jgi:hypothetical protein